MKTCQAETDHQADRIHMLNHRVEMLERAFATMISGDAYRPFRYLTQTEPADLADKE